MNRDNLRNLDGESFITKYLGTLKSKSTVRQYNKSIRDFLEYIHGKRDEYYLADFVVNTSTVSDYEQKLKEKIGLPREKGGIKISTFNAKIKGVRSFYDWLYNETTINTLGLKLLSNNPFANTRIILEKDRQGSDVLEKYEIINMLDNPCGINQHTKNRNILMLELALTTGVRTTALFAIKEEHFAQVKEK